MSLVILDVYLGIEVDDQNTVNHLVVDGAGVLGAVANSDVGLSFVGVLLLEETMSAFGFLALEVDIAANLKMVEIDVEAEIDSHCSIELNLIYWAGLDSIPHSEHV